MCIRDSCGPEGLGGVALSGRVLAEASPTLIGWRSLQDETRATIGDPDPFHHDSRRFEVATSCVPLLAGLRCSIDLLEQEGNAARRLQRIQTLSGGLWEGLSALPGVTPLLSGPPPAGLVSFQLSNGPAPATIVNQFGQQAVWIRHLDDPLCLRACTHICTTEEEVQALIMAVRNTTSQESP